MRIAFMTWTPSSPRALVAAIGMLLIVGCARDSASSTQPIPPARPEVTRVSIATPAHTDLVIRDTLALQAMAFDSSGATISPAPVTWNTSPATPGIAHVDSQGRVVGDSTGYAWVRATSGSHTDSVGIYVHVRPVLKAPFTSAKVAVGSHGTFTIDVVDTVPGYFSTLIPFSLTSSDTGIAVVEHVTHSPPSYFGGVTFDVRGVKDGSANISLVVDGLTASFSVQVFTANFASIVPSNGYRLNEGAECGLTPTGGALCWGPNQAGQLGTTTPAGRRGSGNQYVVTYGPSATPLPVDGDLQFRALAVGEDFACGLTLSDDAYCWGDGAYIGSDATLSQCYDDGYYGYSMTPCSPRPTIVWGEHKFRNLAISGSQTCGVDRGGQSYCWGGGLLDRPLTVAPGFALDTIVPGGGRAVVPTCGLVKGQAYCWSDTSVTAVPQPVTGVPAFSSIGSSGSLDCGLSAAGEVYCWSSDLHATVLPTVLRFQSMSIGYGSWIYGLTASGALYYSTGAPGSSFLPVADNAIGAVNFASIRAGSSARACGMGRDGNAYCAYGSDRILRAPQTP